MDKKNIVERTCCGCRQKKDRNNLIKITLNFETNEIVVNPDNKIFGRSVYLCPEKACLEKAFKKMSVFKMLKKKSNKISKNEVEKIRAVLENIIVLKLY